MQASKTFLLILGVIVLLGIGGLAITLGNSVTETLNGIEVTSADYERQVVILDGLPINVMIADTTDLRRQGLSGVESLGAQEGMLFVFDEPDVQKFWMKGMKIPLDVMWFDETGAFVYVKEAVLPESYPEKFGPDVPVMYVLEMNAGFVAENNLAMPTLKLLN